METRTAVFKVGEMRPNGQVFTAEVLAQLARANFLTLHFDGLTLWETRKLTPVEALEVALSPKTGP